MNIFFNNKEELIQYKEYIEQRFPMIELVTMCTTDNSNNEKWLSLNPKGINKFTTLKKLCTNLNISINEVIYFGDSANDLSLISKVGLCVAMNNALQEVKKQAKKITLSNDNDGIAHFLNMMINKNHSKVKNVT